jgi:membrane-bound serine protease (ClpP class)
MSPRKSLAVLLLALGIASLAGSVPALGQEEAGPVDIVEVEGLIDPPMARFITDRVSAAETDGAQAIVLRLDVPAAVGIDRQAVLRAIGEAQLPVIAWVAPRGAVAEGFGAEVVLTTHVQYLADGASVTLNGRAISELERAEKASSLSEVLQALDGSVVHGTTLETWDEERGFPNVLLRFQELPLWDRLLHAVTTPTAALFLILLGAFGLVFETYNPGIGIAAALGAVLLGFGFYALDVLPTNWWALLVLFASLIALIYEVHVAGFGIFTIGGLVGIGVGSALLFPSGHPALDVGLVTIIAALVLTIVFFVSVMTAALRVRLRRPIDDSEGIVGSVAEAQTDIAPEGTVLSNGTLWRARTMETGIAAGAKVQVKATEGLVLLVEPLHEEL